VNLADQDTTGFSLVELHLQPNEPDLRRLKTPQALASWSVTFNLTSQTPLDPLKTPQALAWWSFTFSLTSQV